ncbi:MAG: hypothetical protein WBA89_18810 [Microcoleus sp.]|uniref:hypothetical protein n=1 Tax=Microcoleus sp. TaxID=44472 RepID=UPI003C747A15
MVLRNTDFPRSCDTRKLQIPPILRFAVEGQQNICGKQTEKCYKKGSIAMSVKIVFEPVFGRSPTKPKAI